MEKILLNYLKENEGQFFKKGQLYALGDEYGYSPETVGRDLRELAKRGIIKVEYYDGKYAKNLAKYAYNPIHKKVQVIEREGQLLALLN